ncbi:MAG: haloacid dehalogenase type II [Microvirga sp.]|jgi:2-haloacid dehalogenase|nr:haloacid dehalogenase type II [Beijerinckiaceae bacterium]
MPPSADLLAGRRAVVFDAYGTLFDVHAAVALHAAAVGPDAARLSEVWRAKQLEYSWVLSLAGRYEPFWTLTERALDHAFARCPTVDRALREPLLDAYRTLDAFPDAAATLAGLRERGLRTGILSNGSPAMLASAVRSAALGPLLDAVLSVDAAGVFKTSPRTYALVTAALDCAPEEVVFVSSNRWDVAGAAAFGFSAVWVNRAGLPDEYAELPPAAVVADLSGILGL